VSLPTTCRADTISCWPSFTRKATEIFPPSLFTSGVTVALPVTFCLIQTFEIVRAGFHKALAEGSVRKESRFANLYLLVQSVLRSCSPAATETSFTLWRPPLIMRKTIFCPDWPCTPWARSWVGLNLRFAQRRQSNHSPENTIADSPAFPESVPDPGQQSDRSAAAFSVYGAHKCAPSTVTRARGPGVTSNRRSARFVFVSYSAAASFTRLLPR